MWNKVLQKKNQTNISTEKKEHRKGVKYHWKYWMSSLFVLLYSQTTIKQLLNKSLLIATHTYCKLDLF